MATATLTDKPTLAFAASDGSEHELLLVRRGRRTGAHTIIAVHSTVLGPALGGCRLWSYANLREAIDDALRLSSAMTLKAAAARLPLGGGKAVIFPPAELDPTGSSRAALLDDFADTLNMLDGTYITAEDVGMSTADMDALSQRSPHVVGTQAHGGSGDPGVFTATGVLAAIRACCGATFGSSELQGRSVAVVGLGHVGEPLAELLHEAGAELVLADVDPRKQRLAAQLGAVWLDDPREALRAEVDVLAPCALGGVLDESLAPELRARIVCGSANNQLAAPEIADVLAARGVLYAPDFIVNSGGLINVSLELTGYDPDLALSRAREIEDVLGSILEHAFAADVTPLAAAVELANERIALAAG